ncbi:MAG: lysophospholipid acyltransferase family protein [Thermoanaerobaculales bacterium]
MDEKGSPDSTNALAGISELKPSLVGSAMYYLLPVRRRIVMDNLRQVFGNRLNERELRRLARCFYSHFTKTIAENLAMIVSSERRIAGQVDVIGVEHVLAAAEQGKGVLILTGHFGNWELSAVAAMLQFSQYQHRFHVIRKSLSPGLENIVFGRFRKAGLEIISAVDALSHVTDALEKNDVVIFIMDQHAVVGSKAIAVEFLGKEAGTNRSLALIAARSGAPVVPASSYRKPDGRHVMRFFEPLECISADNSREEIYLNTLGYNRVLEQFVLDHPDQWFWMHRRWKIGVRRETSRRQRELEMGRR